MCHVWVLPLLSKEKVIVELFGVRQTLAEIADVFGKKQGPCQMTKWLLLPAAFLAATT
jgi:hypothetical protein